MNAVIGLCHFCEAHGPKPVFCTFTSDDHQSAIESTNPGTQCNGCRSLGPDTVLLTKESSGTVYCSRESIPSSDVTTLLRQAAIRSITCEVSWSKEGGIVYFSESRGHVLSYTFQLKDTRARGLKRWFSFIVLMKDKMMLLNLTTLLSEHMQKLAKELQDMAEKVYGEEQQVCSQRALRLTTGSNYFGQSRPLTQLTGDVGIFQKLHNHFTWMLKAGSMTYKEKLHNSKDLLDKLNCDTKGISIFTPNICNVMSSTESMPLRALENLISKDVFRIILYCTLVGIKIKLLTSKINPLSIKRSISRIVPAVDPESVPNISISIEDNITNPSSESICILEDNEDKCTCQWNGTLPIKCPTLMTRIEEAMQNSKFDDNVLHQHVKCLQLQWLGIARTMKSAIETAGSKSDAVVKLKKVLGITAHDELLLIYWISAFCM